MILLMTYSQKPPSLGSAELAVQEVNGFMEVRLATAPNDGDPFVGISVHDNPDAGHPYTTLRTSGVSQYDNLDMYGRNSSVGIGSQARIEVTTGLLDDARRLDLAQKIAHLAFELSEQQ